MKYLLATDTETGSINPKNGDLLTLYVGMVDENFNVVEELDLKVKPDGGRLPIAEAGALKVNGIDLIKHMEDPTTVTYSEAKVKIIALIRKYLKKTGRYSNIRTFGYNVHFDINWLQEYILPKDEWETLIHYATMDVNVLVNFFKDCGFFPPDIGNLGSVVDYLQIPKRHAHSAKDDTLMTLGVYVKIIEIMKSKREGGSTQDLIALLESE